MDIYTKIFLINFFVMVFTAKLDKHILKNSLEATPIIGTLLGGWAFISIVSVPLWVGYFLWNL